MPRAKPRPLCVALVGVVMQEVIHRRCRCLVQYYSLFVGILLLRESSSENFINTLFCMFQVGLVEPGRFPFLCIIEVQHVSHPKRNEGRNPHKGQTLGFAQ